MSYTDAPIPNTPEAKFGAYRKGTEERIKRLEQPSTTPPDIPIPIVGARFFTDASGFLSTPVTSAAPANEPRYRSTLMRRPYRDCVEVRFGVITPAATTLVVQLRDAISGVQTAEFGIGASVNAMVWMRWLHGQSTDFASSQTFQLEIRSGRASGSGSSSILMPDQCLFVSSNLLDAGDADADGNPQLI